MYHSVTKQYWFGSVDVLPQWPWRQAPGDSCSQPGATNQVCNAWGNLQMSVRIILCQWGLSVECLNIAFDTQKPAGCGILWIFFFLLTYVGVGSYHINPRFHLADVGWNWDEHGNFQALLMLTARVRNHRGYWLSWSGLLYILLQTCTYLFYANAHITLWMYQLNIPVGMDTLSFNSKFVTVPPVMIFFFMHSLTAFYNG